MTSSIHTDGSRPLRAGHELDTADTTRLWRVRHGVVGIVHDLAGVEERPQFLALPGDLVGADALAGVAPPSRVFAVTAAELEAVQCLDAAARHELLSLAYAQSRRQGREIVRLRTGSVADRVKQMLLLLGEGDADAEESEVEVPSLRRLADILDASPEAICRVIGRMRQLDVLSAREHRRARVSTRALNDLVPRPGMSSSLPGYRLERSLAL
jgi:CRP-like cAMP-binding protein